MKVWAKTSLLFFFIATLIGAMLRWAFVAGTSWMDYRNFMHAHSHIAILGWAFLMLYTLLIFSFLKKEQQQSRKYKILFGLQVISCTGMLIAFPIQGYAPVSIAFSTFHIIISYFFTWSFWKDLKSGKRNSTVATLFAKTSLIFMVISTLALWAMAPIMVSGLKGTALYYATVQFYLHFQFNGWFVFAVLGLFFKLFENNKVVLPINLIRPFFVLLIVSCFLTYALAVAWGNPLPIVFWINGIGVSIQLVALIYFLLILKILLPHFKKNISGFARLLIGIAIGCFILKILVQTAVVVPFVATVAYTVRNFVIGFIHLMLLGVISHFLLGYAQISGLIDLKSKLAKAGVSFFITGFLLTELLLFGQGLLLWGAIGFLPYYYESLFICSALFPVGAFMILISQFYQKAIPSQFEQKAS